MNIATSSIVQFDLPQYLSCPLPTEERGVDRDQVRLLVSSAALTRHANFTELPAYLQKGDVLVVNTSATIPSALPISLPNGRKGRLHISTKLGKEWLIEIREIIGNKTRRWHNGIEGMAFELPSGAGVSLKKKFYQDVGSIDLWIAEFNTPLPFLSYLNKFALPIQYEKLGRQYPLSYYQTFFSFHPGSSEMPSAGRGFTKNLIRRLLQNGIVIAPLILHTGISSLEENEFPYPEYMEIDPVTASIINNANDEHRRIIAVGTTAIRAVESAVNNSGKVVPYRGNTELFIDEDYQMKMVNGLLTGFHEPHASHLHMLQSLAGYEHIRDAYREAIKHEYHWHQFGDLHLILPGTLTNKGN